MTDRRRAIALRRQVRQLSPLLVLWGLGAMLVAGAGLQRWVSASELFLDPSYVTGAPWYTGVLSNVGILAWTVAACASAAGSWVARQTARPQAAEFLGAAAVVTVVLLADDLLQLHGEVLLGMGVPQVVGQALMVVPALWWLQRYRAEILRTRWLVLGAALCGLGVSYGVDSVWSLHGDREVLLEDGAKLLGLLAWAQYFVLTALDIARSTLRAWHTGSAEAMLGERVGGA